MNALVYRLYQLAPEEIAMVEATGDVLYRTFFSGYGKDDEANGPENPSPAR